MVQLPAPAGAREEPARLSREQVERVFTEHVPGVREFLYQQNEGKFSLNFIQESYVGGIRKFQGTPLHSHYLGCLRSVVHHGFDRGEGASKHLREVAEAFMDCQDVQARVVERVGLQLRNVTLDLRGHLVTLISNYKKMALQMLAVQETGSMNTVHYENWLLCELGKKLGFDVADIKRAEHDAEVKARFHPMSEKERTNLSKKIQTLFDVRAMLKAFAAEANGFSDTSSADSLPRQLLSWAAEHLTHPHVLFDDMCTSVQIDDALATAITEFVLLGQTYADSTEEHRGVRLRSLFRQDDASERAPALGSDLVHMPGPHLANLARPIKEEVCRLQSAVNGQKMRAPPTSYRARSQVTGQVAREQGAYQRKISPGMHCAEETASPLTMSPQARRRGSSTSMVQRAFSVKAR